MKKFKMLKSFESAKLTKEQMNQTTGGMRSQCTSGTYSVCHVDGTTDCDCRYDGGYAYAR